jgi:uncharacterized membrane protein SirB2
VTDVWTGSRQHQSRPEKVVAWVGIILLVMADQLILQSTAPWLQKSLGLAVALLSYFVVESIALVRIRFHA